MESLYADLRWTLRLVRRRPGFGLVMCLTLAVAVAAASAAYGLARSMLWKPLPFPDESALVFVWEETEREGALQPMRVTGSRFDEWRRTSRTFASIAAFGAAGFTAEGPEGVTSLRGVRVSTNYFDTLGVAPALGRGFVAADGVAGRHQVVILSHAFWQQWFGGRRTAVGSTLRLSGNAYTIVGVMPPLVFPAWPVNPATVTLDGDSRMLWVPIVSTDLAARPRAHVLGVVGRLRAGVSLPQAESDIRMTAADAPDTHPARVLPFRDQFVSGASTSVLTLLGAALAVLLTACANLAALQATAFETRRGELGIRLAVGAGRIRIARQLATETLLLSVVSGAAGLALTRLALVTLPASLPPEVPFLTPPALDGPVVLFGVMLSVIAAGCLAVWPIARAHMASPIVRSAAPPGNGPLFRALVAVQIALATALVVCGGLLQQSLWTVRSQDPGFVVDRVVVMDVSLPAPADASPAQVVAAERRLLDALSAVPGASSVAAAYDHPLEANWRDSFVLAGALPARDDVDGSAELRIVSPEYVAALGVQVIDGRALQASDDLDAPGAVMVNEAFVRWAGGAPLLNRRIRSGTPRFNWTTGVPDEFHIVGIVEDERFRGLELPSQPAVYMSTRQFPQRGVTVLVRTTGDAETIMGTLRGAVRSVDPGAAVGRVATLEQILREQLATRHVTGGVINGFAAAALALALLGLYGLLALLVSSRMRETGIRIALGASPAATIGRIVRESVVTAIAGIVAGILIALAAGSLLESLLVGVTSRDVRTVAVVSVAVLFVAAVTSLVPARRAARIDPVVVLREG